MAYFVRRGKVGKIRNVNILQYLLCNMFTVAVKEGTKLGVNSTGVTFYSW